MRREIPAIVLLLSVVFCGPGGAAEPNETFATATILSPAVRSVTDELTVAHVFPDTLLGILNAEGEIVLVDDDESIYGDGFASGLRGLPVDGNAVRFAVTGFGDDLFDGTHNETGQYEVFVDVFNEAQVLIDTFSEVRTLMPGVFHEFEFADAAWLGGTFDVNINNINGANDVDFFTFTGLRSGAAFTVRTQYAGPTNLDTYLGWFNAAGELLAADDDGGGGLLSLIEGTVPAERTLTFAVSGFRDAGFNGSHSRAGEYELVLVQEPSGVPGDFNDDGRVDGGDYVRWRNHLGEPTEENIANGDGGGVAESDYALWKDHYGEPSGGAGGLSHAAPEPTTAFLVALGVAFLFAASRRVLRP